MAELNFDARKVKPNTGFEPVPGGDYVAVMTASEVRATKAGTGKYLMLTFKIIKGEHKGRQLIDRLNLWNPNPQAVEIAKGTLSAICHAVDVLQPQDSTELHNLQLMLKVIQKPRDDNGEMTNEIDSYSPLTKSAPTTSQETPQTDSTGSAPWGE